MKLTEHLTHEVTSENRRRGDQYYREQRVHLLQGGPNKVEARVTGTAPYKVSLQRDGASLVAECSCPYFESTDTCKHIWATILAAGDKGFLFGSTGEPPYYIETDYDDPLVSDVSDLPTILSLPEVPFPVYPPLPPKPAVPDWRALVDLAKRPGLLGSQPVDGQILYTLDVTASRGCQKLMLEIAMRKRKVSGGWAKAYPIRVSRSDLLTLPEPLDRRILGLVAGSTSNLGYSYGYGWGQGGYDAVPFRAEVPDPTAPLLLELACKSRRCFLRLDGKTLDEPLAWDSGEAWELWLDVTSSEAQTHYELTGSLRRGDERRSVQEPLLLLPNGLMVHDNVASRFDYGDAFGWLPLLRRPMPVRVPFKDGDELVGSLLASAHLPRLDLPEELRYSEVRSVPQPRLRLLPPERRYAYPESPRGIFSCLYGEQEIVAGSPAPGVFDPTDRTFTVRDPEAEARFTERLVELGFRDAPERFPDQYRMRITNKKVPSAIRALLAEGWLVEAHGRLYRSPSRFGVGVSSGIDWFELHGDADFDGQVVKLPALLAALKRGDGYVQLGDGTLGLLPEEWLRRLAPVARLGRSEDDHVRFHRAQVGLLDALLTGEAEARCDEVFTRAREQLTRFAGVEPLEPPASFRGTLRGYQKVGLGWLRFLGELGLGGCLADDMGLGKTIQVLALLERRRIEGGAARGPSLVVVPRSLIFNWLAEAERFTPELHVLDHTGIDRTRHPAAFAASDLVLTTYGTLRRDIGLLSNTEFDYLIFDEAQAIKNAGSETAKAARLLKGGHRLALTGTPIENHLGELWSLLELLNPGMLGTTSVLQKTGTELRNPDPETRTLLSRAVRPIVLRRTKQQVAAELPEKVEQTVWCELPPRQRKLYDELRAHYRASLGARVTERGLGRVKILVLEALLRLRQAACHPALLDRRKLGEPSAKLDALLPQLKEIVDEGHKALVFSQFTSFLALVRTDLDREGLTYAYLDGQTRDRQAQVERFQTDANCPLFLISLKAGGLGLNLTAAEYVYLLDPWWNPAVEAQAIDRAHRIGQTRQVFAYRLVARDTVEEKILELQKSKRELADAIIQEDQSLIARLTREDLELLLS